LYDGNEVIAEYNALGSLTHRFMYGAEPVYQATHNKILSLTHTSNIDFQYANG
jgi:hypothetical protein